MEWLLPKILQSGGVGLSGSDGNDWRRHHGFDGHSVDVVVGQHA